MWINVAGGTHQSDGGHRGVWPGLRGSVGWGGRCSPEGLPRKAGTGVLVSISEDWGALGSLQWGLVWALNSSLPAWFLGGRPERGCSEDQALCFRR